MNVCMISTFRIKLPFLGISGFRHLGLCFTLTFTAPALKGSTLGPIRK